MKNLRNITAGILSFLIILNMNLYANTFKQVSSENIIISGKVIDAETENPIAFVSITAKGTNIGTITNTEGEFTIRFGKSLNVQTLTFKYIGYQNREISLSSVTGDELTVKLTPSVIPIQEVIVRPNDPKGLIKKIIRKIPENYSTVPNKELAFYREYIKKRRKYVSVSEAVVEIYKAPYNKDFSTDMVKLYKGHKSAKVKAQDTIIMKLKGGPKTALLLDIAKNPYTLFSDENLNQYNFTLNKVTNINNQPNYIINFIQKPGQEIPLYNGKLYINIKTLAITAAEFSLNLENKVQASKAFVLKKPLLMTIRPENTKYIVSYTESNGKYYFSHARGEISFSVKWKKKLFKSHYSIMTEIAVTDRTDKNVQKIPGKDRLRANIIFDEKVYPFSDEDFWGKYNTIKPEESIEKTIKKYGVRLKIQEN